MTLDDGNGAIPPAGDIDSHEPLNGQSSTTNGAAPFELNQQWHSEPRKLRVIHVGAGATGLCAAYKMERQLDNYDLVCYEKNSDIGGTWLENRYPGCACDVPSHIYTYTFEPNPNWTSYFAYAPEIYEYFLNFCNKYDLWKYITLNHKVVSAKWHEDKGQYEVQVEHDGRIFTDWCHVLVNGSGLLNKWRWPDIQGLHDFNGPLIHSAHWDPSVDLEGKKVAVLGTGSSAIQIIPQIQKVASKMKCFMRGNTWIASPMPRVKVEVDPESSQSMDQQPGDAAGEEDNLNIQQYTYKPHEIEKLASDPEYHLQYRKQIEYGISRFFAIFYKDTDASNMASSYMASQMAARLKNHPVLTEKLIPSWPVGCRRITPGDGYLEALIEPNVEPVYEEITSVHGKGMVTADGSFHEVDAIICATGFDMAWTPHFELRGMNDVDIRESWSPHPNCYLGMAAPGFPNYWVMNGPRGNLCNGTVLPCFETQLDYMIKAVKKMQSDRIYAMQVKPDVTHMLNRYIEKWHEGSVWSADCRSWYKNNTKDGKIMCWGGSSIHYLKTIKYPRWEHFDIRYLDGDPWGFLGDGRTKGEVEGDFEGLTPYLRNADTPWDVV